MVSPRSRWSACVAPDRYRESSARSRLKMLGPVMLYEATSASATVRSPASSLSSYPTWSQSLEHEHGGDLRSWRARIWVRHSSLPSSETAYRSCVLKQEASFREWAMRQDRVAVFQARRSGGSVECDRRVSPRLWRW